MTKLLPATLAAVALLACAATSAAAPASELPECGERAALVYETAPAVSRVGESIALKMRSIDMSRVSNLVVTTISHGERRETPVSLTGTENQIVTVPGWDAVDTQAWISITWDQEVETSNACHGFHAYSLPNIPVGASVGNFGLPRLAGRYLVRSFRGQRVSHLRWPLRPSCDYFGCRSLVVAGSWRGMRLHPMPSQSGYQAVRHFGRQQTCRIKYRFGLGPLRTKTIPRAWNFTITFKLHPDRVRPDGLTETFRGSIRFDLIPTRRAARWRCPPAHLTEPMFGRRIG